SIIKFLHRRCPLIVAGGPGKYGGGEESLPKAAQLPPDTLSTIIGCLQGCIGNVSPEVTEMIVSISQYGILMNTKSRAQAPQPQQQQQQPTFKLWGGRYTKTTDHVLAKVNNSLSVDKRLYAQDIDGSIAYAKCLAEAGLLTQSEYKVIVYGLETCRAEWSKGTIK
ncbi:hypothetical protein HBI98_22660, partial [Aeromonas veronii]|nr:hypothetical protein [Aeromonas veronii]